MNTRSVSSSHDVATDSTSAIPTRACFWARMAAPARDPLLMPPPNAEASLAMAPQWSDRLWVTEPLHAEARRPRWASSAVTRCATFPRTPHTPPMAAAQVPLGASLATDPLARQAVHQGWSGCPGHRVGPFSVVGRGFRFASEPDPDPTPGPHWAVGAAPQRTSHRYAPKPEQFQDPSINFQTRKFDDPPLRPAVSPGRARIGN